MQELAEIHAQDRQFFGHHASNELLLPMLLAELLASGERAERRAALHQELYQVGTGESAGKCGRKKVQHPLLQSVSQPVR